MTVRQYDYLFIEDENGKLVKNPDTVKISTAYAESPLKNVRREKDSSFSGTDIMWPTKRSHGRSAGIQRDRGP